MFSLPEFPITCDVYTMLPTWDFADRVFRFTSVCQLRLYGQHIRFAPAFTTALGASSAGSSLLLPPFIDIRDPSTAGGVADLVEVPSASGRWYLVEVVDDVAKGFANEYRLAVIGKVFSSTGFPTFPAWPTPIP